jgi:hypothetical protein
MGGEEKSALTSEMAKGKMCHPKGKMQKAKKGKMCHPYIDVPYIDVPSNGGGEIGAKLVPSAVLNFVNSERSLAPCLIVFEHVIEGD